MKQRRQATTNGKLIHGYSFCLHEHEFQGFVDGMKQHDSLISAKLGTKTETDGLKFEGREETNVTTIIRDEKHKM